jgi:hypothetical protein
MPCGEPRVSRIYRIGLKGSPIDPLVRGWYASHLAVIPEMSGNFNHLGNLALVCFSSFAVSELTASCPVYTVLLERLERPRHSLSPDAPRGDAPHPLG